MEVLKTTIADCLLIKPKIFEDHRGFFFESFKEEAFQNNTGIQTRFVQDNQSISYKGVLRGLHYQTGKFAQAKLIRVVLGEILDVAVDIRKNSSAFGSYTAFVLNDRNNYHLYIPKGFAHGFLVLSEKAILTYKCDAYYCKAAEAGIRFNDPTLAIDWGLKTSEMILSEKDLSLPFLQDLF